MYTKIGAHRAHARFDARHPIYVCIRINIHLHIYVPICTCIFMHVYIYIGAHRQPYALCSVHVHLCTCTSIWEPFDCFTQSMGPQCTFYREPSMYILQRALYVHCICMRKAVDGPSMYIL